MNLRLLRVAKLVVTITAMLCGACQPNRDSLDAYETKQTERLFQLKISKFPHEEGVKAGSTRLILTILPGRLEKDK